MKKIDRILENFKTELNEKIEAEIVKNKIPPNKVFDQNGNLIKNLTPWRQNLQDILNYINKNFPKAFTKDADPPDITLPDVKHGEGHIATIISDDGKINIKYDVKTRKFFK